MLYNLICAQDVLIILYFLKESETEIVPVPENAMDLLEENILNVRDKFVRQLFLWFNQSIRLDVCS